MKCNKYQELILVDFDKIGTEIQLIIRKISLIA